MTSSLACPSNSVARGANLPPVSNHDRGVIQLLTVKPDSWLGWFSQLLEECLERHHRHISLVMRKPVFAYAKTKTQISFAVTAKLISAFVFASRKIQFLYFLNLKFQPSGYLLWSYRLVCVGPGRKPRRPVFSQRGSCHGHFQHLHPEKIEFWQI